MQSSNPFNKWKLGWRPLDAAPRNPGGNLTPANHKTPGGESNLYGMSGMGAAPIPGLPLPGTASMRVAKGEPVALPPNLYTPPSAESLQLFNEIVVPAATVVPIAIFTYQVPQQVMAQLIDYELETDGPTFTNFFPVVNGVRVYPQHGNPSAGFAINRATTGNPSGAQLPLKPGDIFQWLVNNTDAAPHTVSARSSGFIISGQRYEDTRFGG